MFDKELIESMLNTPIRNYAVPGLTSCLVGGGDYGRVRLFESERSQQRDITPHSHRFDFQCFVLHGFVTNRIWERQSSGWGDKFRETALVYLGEPGKYETKPVDNSFWTYQDSKYETGTTYSMKAEEVHSIFFSKGARVLFFEGPARLCESIVLEPIVTGEVIPTFKTEEWMFKRS